jgi:hypothetical protein
LVDSVEKVGFQPTKGNIQIFWNFRYSKINTLQKHSKIGHQRLNWTFSAALAVRLLAAALFCCPTMDTREGQN